MSSTLILNTPRIGAGRFAPTPTGRLHLGNARTAFLAWLGAQSENLRTILRIEDLDPKAIPKGCLEGIYDDLDWLGLTYDECPRVGGPVGPYRQSERFSQYDVILDKLNRLGCLYPCWCSRKEVRQAAIAPHASDEGPIYAGTCRPSHIGPLKNLDNLPKKNGRTPALRLDVRRAIELLDTPTMAFNDTVAGPQSFDLEGSIGDFVVRRVDGVAAYQIACAWDDIAMGCTQVLRGNDLLPSTARQLLVIRLLKLPEPQYGHVGLVLSATGERLSKRDGSTAIEEIRDVGIEPAMVIRHLARMTGLPDTSDLDHLTDAFRICDLRQTHFKADVRTGSLMEKK
ncbi:MAG: tRNA glutamyl-Q(34) synthetase GluQRS [Myxococcota bacterium]|nr:tRNA glutamyl-Q(34) synthetase GluQRS [Myxococcota bacterium]